MIPLLEIPHPAHSKQKGGSVNALPVHKPIIKICKKEENMQEKAMKIRAKEVIIKLQKMFGEGVEFACVDCHKTNKTLTGITMKLPGCSKVAVFYLEDMPKTASVEEIANIAAAAFQEAMRYIGDGQVPSLPTLSREYILGNVVLQAVGRMRNRQLLREHPHVLCLDLAGIFRIPIGKYEKNSRQSMLLSNQIAEKFSLSSDELTAASRRNTLNKFGVKFLHARETSRLFPEMGKRISRLRKQ